MKFWEVISAFRDDPNLLFEVFSSEKWRHPYLERYSSLKGWTEISRPSFLDDDVPLELAREIAARYTKDTFLFYPAKQQIHMANKHFDVFPQEERISLTALEILDQFGGSLLEEILEKSSATISQD